MIRKFARRGLKVARTAVGVGKGLLVGDRGVGYGVSEYEDFERIRAEAAEQDRLEGNVTSGAEMDAIADGTREISAEDLRVLLEIENPEDHPVLLDVRQDHEWRSGHLPGARHIPLEALDTRTAELDSARPVVTYGSVGMRGIDASYVLKRAGFADVRSLAGGVEAWREAGSPLHTPD